MYGFESLILLTLHGGATLWSGHPFYPADIASAVDAMPRPRMLVTTPAHLRALVTDGAPCPAVDKLLSATAQLPETLCRQAEAAFCAPLYEIYGSTETGQIASRRSSQTRHWKLLSGIELKQRDGQFWACGGHVLQATPLSDTIRVVDRDHFDLIGRNSDMINIAGKRGSLAFFNHALLEVPGVADACVFVPDTPANTSQDAFVFPDSTRLCAVVVAPQLTEEQILRSLRAQVDPVFLPRPIIFVATLPRNATGKIPREALLELFEQHQRRVRRAPA
jgi:acyl-coenzyme A synthetase/AMP-(fatty) acid ligase